MKKKTVDSDPQALREENEQLRQRLAEAEQALRAIREGEVDAIVVSGRGGERVFSLAGAERVYRLIVETMHEAAVTVALDGTILFCNGQFGKFVGLAQEEILGHALTNFVAPGQRDAVSALIARSQNEPVWQRLVFQGPGGQTVPAHVSANVLDRPDGVSVCVVATDLSELETSTQMLQELRHQREALRASEERLRVTLTSIGDAVMAADAHGHVTFLNPVAAALTGWSSEGALGQPVGSVLRIVNAETHEPREDLVGRVLAEARVIEMADHNALLARDGREIPVEDSAAPILDATGQVTGVVVVFHDVTERRRVRRELERLNADLERRTAEAQAANESKGRFLANMSHEIRTPLNAIVGLTDILLKGPLEDLPATARAPAGARTQRALLVVNVRDTGIGISADQAELLFEPFTQADVTTTRRFGGTGLGLTICRRLVELMGGKIAVESELGRGSCFEVRIPFPRAKIAPGQERSEAPADPEQALRNSERRVRLLLTEDNEINRMVVEGMLEGFPVDIEMAKTGREAARLASERAFDVIVMDVQMPEMDGYTATAAIREHERTSGGRRTPIIALTAHVSEGDAKRCLDAGMDAYLAKPVAATDLMAAVVRWGLRKDEAKGD